MHPEVEPALRALLGLPDHVPLTWSRQGGPPPGRFGRLDLEVHVGASSLALHLLDGSPSPLPSWLETGALQLRVAQPSPGADEAALFALARRLGTRFRRNVDAPSLATLRQVLAEDGTRSFNDLSRHHARDTWDIWHHMDGEAERAMGLLRLGFRCNQDCWFCWQGRDWPDAPGDAIARIDRLADEGARILTITGGEPTTFQELPALIAHGVERGMEVSIQTNAIAFSRPKTLRRLLDAGLRASFVSFHSANESVSDAMTRAPGTWEPTVRGIEAGLEAGLHIRLNCVVERTNAPGLPEHAAFIVDRFVPRATRYPLGVAYSHPSRYLDHAAYAAHVAPLDEVAGLVQQAAAALRAAGVTVELLGSCGFPPCVVQDVPGVIDQVRDAMFPSIHTVSRVPTETCEGCALMNRCLGPRREYLEVYGERGLRPIQ